MSEPPSQADELEDAFEHAPCGYLLLEATGRVARVNTTFADWLGVPAADLQGRHFRDLLTVPSRIFYETSFAPLLRLHGALEEVALDFTGGASGKVPVLVNAAERRNTDDRLISIRVIAVRASERRGYERYLQNREAVAVQMLADEQEASGLREQFIAILGHDLRNPLAAITSGVRLLQRDPSKEKAELIAGMLHASVLRMSGMIENVLDFARGRLGGGISLNRGPSDLETAMVQVVDELRSVNPGRDIREDYRLPALVNCDAPRISQMLSNLVGNACTHGDPATFIAVAAFVSGGTLEISVANGGTPIPEHKMRSLFEPFSHEPGSAPKQGLGLGLFIASQIAESHGGVLTAASSASETRFTFRMPLASA